MFGKLLLLFTIVPAIELYLLIQIGQEVGGLATLALVLLTGALGAALARAEGLRVLRAWQAALAEGRVPEDGLANGLLVLVGGVLLITPGLLSDVTGLLLLVPVVRRPVARYLTRRVERAISRGTIQVMSTQPFGGGPLGAEGWGRTDWGPPRRDPGVITVEGESVSSRPSQDDRDRDGDQNGRR